MCVCVCTHTFGCDVYGWVGGWVCARLHTHTAFWCTQVVPVVLSSRSSFLLVGRYFAQSDCLYCTYLWIKSFFLVHKTNIISSLFEFYKYMQRPKIRDPSLINHTARVSGAYEAPPRVQVDKWPRQEHIVPIKSTLELVNLILCLSIWQIDQAFGTEPHHRMLPRNEGEHIYSMCLCVNSISMCASM